MKFLILICLLNFSVGQKLLGGEFVKEYQVPVSTSSTSDPYTCFVDSPNAHATTGCRKKETICESGQAIAYDQFWRSTDYVWRWQCSFNTFQQCGLQWCSEKAFCRYPNLCICNPGLAGSPIVECYNATRYYSNKTFVDCNSTNIHIKKALTSYKNLFIVFLSLTCFLVVSSFISFLWLYLLRNSLISGQKNESTRQNHGFGIRNPVYIGSGRITPISGSDGYPEISCQ